jgi:hypothetical protein
MDNSAEATTKGQGNGGSIYDPESRYLDDPSLNLNDPDEVAAHLHVQQVHAKYKQQRLKRICLGTLLAFLLAAGLFAFFEVNRSRTSSGSSDASTKSSSLPPPPTDLALICSTAQLQGSLEGYTKCQAACEVAECCSLSPEFALSCQAGNEDTCAAYSADCNLLQVVDRPVVGGGGVTVPSPEANTSQPQAAPSSPAPVTAPTMPTPTATTTGPAGNSDTTGAVTKEEIDDACQNHSNAVGNQQSLCHSVCAPGACCFDNSGPCTEEQLQGMDLNTFCNKYESCPHQEHISAESLTQLCSSSQSSKRAECLSECATAACCFSTTVAEMCIHVNPDIVCSNYNVCEVFFNNDGT